MPISQKAFQPKNPSIHHILLRISPSPLSAASRDHHQKPSIPHIQVPQNLHSSRLMMGYSHTFGISNFSISLFFLLLFIISCVSSSPSPMPPTVRSMYNIKKTRQLLVNDQESFVKNKNGLRRKRFKSKNFDTRTFSAMLPKGFVPPSGSSPCHNEYPSSVTFFCDFSTKKSP